MVHIEIQYTGDLHTTATHGPSGDSFPTDAPVDNQGKGEHFSPTDLVPTALGSCMLTIMGIKARDKGIPLAGAVVRARKTMSTVPRRRIGLIELDFQLPSGIPATDRPVLESAARDCPVAGSLAEDVEVRMTFTYPD